MKLVTDVYEKRSAVSLKVESCMTVLLESYWIIIGESWVATLFHVHHIEFIHSDVFWMSFWKVLGMNLTKFFLKQYNFKSKCRVPLQFALKLRNKLRSTLCTFQSKLQRVLRSLLRNFKANCKGNLFFELKLYGFFEKFCEIHAQYFSKFHKTVLWLPKVGKWRGVNVN